jgi:uncharacterized protein
MNMPETPGSELKFIVDENAGKLTKALRMLGFDTLFFQGQEDSHLLRIALAEGRIVLTRDTHILERHVITSGKLKALLVDSEHIQAQTVQVIKSLNLYPNIRPFSRCLEDNRILVKRSREEVRDRVLPYVWQTQNDYVECPECRRLYWKGTHWEAMKKKLDNITGITGEDRTC